MKINIGINDKNRAGSAAILNRLLSDEFVLYTKTRNYHWNVTGPDFSELHKFFEAQYEELDEIMDEVAERSRAIGEKALGSLKDFIHNTQLKETPGTDIPGEKMIENLLTDHETLIQSLRKDLVTAGEKYQDMGTSDFLTGLLEQHEKMAWMLRSYLD